MKNKNAVHNLRPNALTRKTHPESRQNVLFRHESREFFDGADRIAVKGRVTVSEQPNSFISHHFSS